MFEVIPHAGGFTWRILSAAGRVLVYSDQVFVCDLAAANAAKAYRSGFQIVARDVDHRMGACI